MRRRLYFLSLSSVLLAALGCGAASDSKISMSKEEEEKKKQQMMEETKKGMEAQMEQLKQGKPPGSP